MNFTIIQHVSNRGTSWHVKVEGEYMRTKFAHRRAFRSIESARKECIRLCGNDAAFNVVRS